jgi:hypothetical protein
MIKKTDVLMALELANRLLEEYGQRRAQGITDSQDGDVETDKKLRQITDSILKSRNSFLPGISGIPCRACKGTGVQP